MAALPPGVIQFNGNGGGNRPVNAQIPAPPAAPQPPPAAGPYRNLPGGGQSLQNGVARPGMGPVPIQHHQVVQQQQQPFHHHHMPQHQGQHQQHQQMQFTQMLQPGMHQAHMQSPAMQGHQQRPPAERIPKHGVEISDLRHENMNEAGARAELSTYIIIRMEKAYNPNETDRFGKPVIPSWERATRTEETDISQEEAARKVHQLNKIDTAMNKKNDMSNILQRQIERARESLEYSERDKRYDYELAQLESKFREIDESNPLYKAHASKKKDKDKDRDRKDKKNKKDKDREKERSRGRSRGYASESEYRSTKEYRGDKKKSGKKLERASVTAYFKRVPKRSEDAMEMLHERLLSKGQSFMPRNHQQHVLSMDHLAEPQDMMQGQRMPLLPQMPQQMNINPAMAQQQLRPMQHQQPQPPLPQHHQPHHPPPPPPPPPPGMPQQVPVRVQQPQHPPPPPPPPPPQMKSVQLPMHLQRPPQVQPMATKPNIVPVPNRPVTPHNQRPFTPNPVIRTGGHGHGPKVYNDSPRSPRSSHDSLTASDSEAEDSAFEVDYMTAESSIGSSTQYHNQRHPSKHQQRRAEHAEHYGHDATLHRRHTKRDKEYRHPPSPPSTHPSPRLRAYDIDNAINSAVAKACSTMKEEVLQSQRPRPLILRPSSPVARPISSYGVRQAIHQDRLHQMGDHLARTSIDGEDRRGRPYRRERDYHYSRADDEFERGIGLDSIFRRRDVADYDDDEGRVWEVPRARKDVSRDESRYERENPMTPAGRYRIGRYM